MANVLIGHVKGPKGDAATVSVGTTTTGAAGSDAAVTNSGTSSAAVLSFTIPKGDKGDAGTPGVTDYATSSAAGLVRVGADFNINSSNGTLSMKDTFTQASTLANITSGEAHTTILGKIAKAIASLIPVVNDWFYASHTGAKVINNLTTTQEGYALDARQGKALHDALGSFRVVSASISGSGNTAFTFPSNSRLVLITMTGSGNSQGEYIINVTSVGAVTYTAIKSASALTFAVTTNTLTITNSIDLTIGAYFLVFAGGFTG